jgi:hypothetical protein
MEKTKAKTVDAKLEVTLTFITKTKSGEYTPVREDIIESRETTAEMTFIRDCAEDDFYYSMR